MALFHREVNFPPQRLSAEEVARADVRSIVNSSGNLINTKKKKFVVVNGSFLCFIFSITGHCSCLWPRRNPNQSEHFCIASLIPKQSFLFSVLVKLHVSFPYWLRLKLTSFADLPTVFVGFDFQVNSSWL